MEQYPKMERPPLPINEDPPPYSPNPTSMSRLPQRISGAFDGRRANFQQMSEDDSDKESLSNEKKICGIPWNKSTCIILAVTIFLFVGGIVAGVLGAVLSRSSSSDNNDIGGHPGGPSPSSNNTGPGRPLGPQGNPSNTTISLTATGCGTDDIFVFFQDSTNQLHYRYFSDSVYESGIGDPWGNITEISLDIPPMLSTPLAATCWNQTDERFFSLIYAGQNSELLILTASCDENAVECTHKNEIVAAPVDGALTNLTSIGGLHTLAASYIEGEGVQLFYTDANSNLQQISAYPSFNQDMPPTQWDSPTNITTLDPLGAVEAITYDDGSSAPYTYLLYTDSQQNLQSMQFHTFQGGNPDGITTQQIATGPLHSPIAASLISNSNSSSIIEVYYHVFENLSSQTGNLDNTWNSPVAEYLNNPPISDLNAPMAAAPWRGNMRIFYLMKSQIVESDDQMTAYQADFVHNSNPKTHGNMIFS